MEMDLTICQNCDKLVDLFDGTLIGHKFQLGQLKATPTTVLCLATMLT